MNQGDLEKVFIEAFSLYGDAIFRFCYVKVSHRELAEDMTQEVFTRYWQYVREGKEMTNTRSFLYTIANNLAKDWYKKKKADSLDEKIEANQMPVATESQPDVLAEYHEVLQVINQLEDKDRELLLLKFVEGLPPKEIAHVMKETPNVISVRLNRATKRLQEKLQV